MKMYNGPMYEWQKVHIFNELKEHSIDIKLINPLEYDSKESLNKAIMLEVKTGDYQLFMTCHGDDVVESGIVKKIRKSIPTLLICFDNLLAPYIHKNVAGYYDLVWLTSFENEYLFKRWGAKTIVMPYAANPYFFVPQNDESIHRIAFIGSPYGSRANTLNQLTSNQIDVDLYSNYKTTDYSKTKTKMTSINNVKTYLKYPIGRKLIMASLIQRVNQQAILNEDSDNIHIFESPEFAEMSRLYSNYSLCFSSTTARNTGILKKPVEIINLRAFEIPMSGGIEFCRYSGELSSYFKEDEEIIFYKNEKEMIEKARYYLYEANQDVITQIKMNARKRAEKEHSWFSRFSKIFMELNISSDEE